MQELNENVHRDDLEWLKAFDEEKRKAAQHVEFCVALYRQQLKQGLHFIHKHPWGASSWKLECVQELLADGSASLVGTHMCRFGMSSHIRERDGDRGLAKQTTGVMTSSGCMAAQLDRRCNGQHDHVHVVGGRASTAQVCPQLLCEAMPRDIAQQKRSTPVVSS